MLEIKVNRDPETENEGMTYRDGAGLGSILRSMKYAEEHSCYRCGSRKGLMVLRSGRNMRAVCKACKAKEDRTPIAEKRAALRRKLANVK